MAALAHVPEQLNDISDLNRLQPIDFEQFFARARHLERKLLFNHPRDVISREIAIPKSKSAKESKYNTFDLNETCLHYRIWR